MLAKRYGMQAFVLANELVASVLVVGGAKVRARVPHAGVHAGGGRCRHVSWRSMQAFVQACELLVEVQA